MGEGGDEGLRDGRGGGWDWVWGTERAVIKTYSRGDGAGRM